MSNPVVIILISILLYMALFVSSVLLFNPNNTILDIITDDLVFAVTIVVLNYLMIKKYKENIFKLLMVSRSISFFIFVSVFLAILLSLLDTYLISPINEIIIPNLEYVNELFTDAYPNLTSSAEYFTAFFSYVIIAPVLEELYFRGFCYNVLRKKYSRTISIISVIVVFIIFHPVPQIFLMAIIINYLLCIMYELSNSLISPILLHSIYNFLGFFQIYPILKL